MFNGFYSRLLLVSSQMLFSSYLKALIFYGSTCILSLLFYNLRFVLQVSPANFMTHVVS